MKNKYTKETLSNINQIYLSVYWHKIEDGDVEVANEFVETIESSRSQTTPKIGDIVRFTNKYGEYYHHAHIDKILENGESYICENPYVPFISKAKDGISCITSGGSWTNVPNEKLKYIGKEEKTFSVWGSSGVCESGAINFDAEVSVWEYAEEDSFYGKCTTKDYVRHFISYRADKYGKPVNGDWYTYFGNGFAFKNRKEYDRWLKTYKGIEFGDFSEGPVAVFAYREAEYLISKEEWNDLDLPIDTRMCNGIIVVKVRYDDDNHIIHTYRYANSSEDCCHHIQEPLYLYMMADKM